MTVVGDSAALLSSAFYAVGYLIIEKLRQHLSTSDILVWRCVCGLVMVTPLVLLVDDVIFPISTIGWLAKYPVFEPHWQVTLADATASGVVIWKNKTFHFHEEPFYAEKNWGGQFYITHEFI